MTGSQPTGSLEDALATHGALRFDHVLRLGADIAEAVAEHHDYGRAHGAVTAANVRRPGPGPWVLIDPPAGRSGRPCDAAALADDVVAIGVIVVQAMTGSTGSVSSVSDELRRSPGPGAPTDLWSETVDLVATVLAVSAADHPTADTVARRMRAIRSSARSRRRVPWRGVGEAGPVARWSPSAAGSRSVR